jgi:hypothetical protein
VGMNKTEYKMNSDGDIPKIVKTLETISPTNLEKEKVCLIIFVTDLILLLIFCRIIL